MNDIPPLPPDQLPPSPGSVKVPSAPLPLNAPLPPLPLSAQPIPSSENPPITPQIDPNSPPVIPPPSSGKSKKVVQSILGVLAIMLVGTGLYFGQQLVTTGGIGDIRQQASLDDIDVRTCAAANSTCCPATNPYYEDGFCHKLDPTTTNPVACPDWAPNPDGECLESNGVICVEVPGGMYCGTPRDGTACAPILDGGGDWCTIIGGGTEADPVSCASLGLMRCKCDNDVWVIGDNDNNSCYELCGATNNTCTHNCNPPDDDTPPPPETHLECRNEACVYVAGGGSNQCANDSDCEPPPGETLVCEGLSASVSNPELGDSVRYTCEGTASPGSVHHYDFQYKIGSGEFTALAEETVGSGQSAPLVISEPGSYTVRCRACKSTDGSNCSAYHSL